MLSHDLIHLLSASFALEYTVSRNLRVVLVFALILQKVMLSDVRGPLAARFNRSIFLLIRDIDGSR